jgi:hypothetical protein
MPWAGTWYRYRTSVNLWSIGAQSVYLEALPPVVSTFMPSLVHAMPETTNRSVGWYSRACLTSPAVSSTVSAPP